MNSSTKRISGVAAAVGLVLVVIWYMALFSPQSKKLSSAHKAHAAAEQQISSLQSQVAELQGLERQIPADTKKLAVFQAAVPNNPQLAGALTQLHLAAIASGATLSSVQPSTPAGTTGGSQQSSSSPSSGEPSISVSMTVAGSYPQLMAFMSLLDRMPRTVVVDHLSLTGAGGKLSGSIAARIFYAGAAAP